MLITPLLLAVHLPFLEPVPARGLYVEARTASVFAGACHYGAEATTGGREAVLFWRFDEGAHGGVDLSGVVVAAAVVGDRNLADALVERRSILFVDGRAASAAREAAVDLLRSTQSDLLGDVLGVEALALETRFEGETFAIRCGEVFELDGALLPDRACCRMPYSVWYAPLASGVSEPVVACNEVFRFESAHLGRRWTRHEENTGFVGAFEIGAPPGCDPGR